MNAENVLSGARLGGLNERTGQLLDILGFPPELAADRLTQLRAELTQITFVERLLSHRLATVT